MNLIIENFLQNIVKLHFIVSLNKWKIIIKNFVKYESNNYKFMILSPNFLIIS
jgi:hypothetical protein